MKKNLFNYYAQFSAKTYSLLAAYDTNRFHPSIRVFNAFDKEYSCVDSHIIKRVIELFEETGDYSFLYEAVVLIMIMEAKSKGTQ